MSKKTLYMIIGLSISMLSLTGCPSEPTGETPVGKWLLKEPVTGQNYYIYVPNRYNHERPTPVIISCHGTVPYDVSNSHIETWKGFGERYGFIIVCPDMVGTDGIFGDGPVNAMLDDEHRIISILSTLGYIYNIDMANVFLTGFSGGGFPTYFVGLRHPDLFRAIAPRNSNFNENNLDGWYPPESNTMPVFIIWGDNDPGTIQDQAKNGVNYLKRKGFHPVTKILPNTGHERKPRYSMDFFLAHRAPAKGTMTPTPRKATRRPAPRTPAAATPTSPTPTSPAPRRTTTTPPARRTYTAPPPP